MTRSTVVEALCERVEKLGPLLREHEAIAEREKRLSPPVLAALREAGLFRMLRPKTRGGFELTPSDEFRVAEALARIDSAAAWNLQVSNASELYGGWFSDAASEELYGPEDSIVAGAWNPHRRAVAVDGGYRITGTTPFNSNCHGATWLIGLADVHDGDTPRLEGGRPVTLLTAAPASACRIVENWNTLGMCGTGSHDVEMDDVFVPERFAVPFGPLESPSSAYATPLTPLAIWVTVGCHASVALGVAQAAVYELVELGSKVPSYTERALRDRSTVQSRLARAEGLLSAARAFFHQAYDEAWDVASSGSLDLATKARCQLASTNVVLAASQAVDLVHACVGTSGIREERRFAKHFRDVHVITQHAFIGEARLESVGQIMLGLEPDWGFFQL